MIINRHISSRSPSTWLSTLLGTAMAIGCANIALAQVEDPSELSTTPAEAVLTHYPRAGNLNEIDHQPQPLRFKPASERTDIGRATNHLLAAQRAASAEHPRWIEGEQASRSYNRYLKSFETEIPEFYETGIKTGTSN
ncbi:DUF3613 domain-containing protein [Lampropedia puyangensis]|uniref:DUF3613 domain-containing protein n=1 Tax=Lampropedia puyangensis TaxID=1330072 RepID=A0A4S8EYI3_9BURK|nr:DUF3613 domain-containing protein [Lampropedia puyangensis]THT99962.1 DUF3613 domain-containing protein [Lampropedia puyangensis]